jgi:hypothetical protein
MARTLRKKNTRHSRRRNIRRGGGGTHAKNTRKTNKISKNNKNRRKTKYRYRHQKGGDSKEEEKEKKKEKSFVDSIKDYFKPDKEIMSEEQIKELEEKYTKTFADKNDHGELEISRVMYCHNKTCSLSNPDYQWEFLNLKFKEFSVSLDDAEYEKFHKLTIKEINYNNVSEKDSEYKETLIYHYAITYNAKNKNVYLFSMDRDDYHRLNDKYDETTIEPVASQMVDRIIRNFTSDIKRISNLRSKKQQTKDETKDETVAIAPEASTDAVDDTLSVGTPEELKSDSDKTEEEKLVEEAKQIKADATDATDPRDIKVKSISKNEVTVEKMGDTTTKPVVAVDTSVGLDGIEEIDDGGLDIDEVREPTKPPIKKEVKSVMKTVPVTAPATTTSSVVKEVETVVDTPKQYGGRRSLI